MWRGSHDSHLFANDGRAATDGNEYLRHDYQANAALRLTVFNNQSDAEELEAKHAHSKPFEAISGADDEGKNNRPEAGAYAVDHAYVANVGNRKIVHSQQILVGSRIPAAEMYQICVIREL